MDKTQSSSVREHRGAKFSPARWFAVPSLLFLILSSVAISSASGSASRLHSAASGIHRGGTLTVDIPNGSWPTLDPALPTAETSEAIYFAQIYGALFTTAPGGKVLPDLATGYKVTNGGKTVTIHLRPGVKFADGTPFNAAAVKFNLLRDASPTVDCLCQTLINPGNDLIKGISTPNTLTDVIELAHPDSVLMSALTTSTGAFMVSPTALKKEGETKFGTSPVGAGPFEVASDVPNNTLDLVRNPHYWKRGEPYLAGIDFVSVGNTTSAISSVASGTAQMATSLAPADLPTAKSLKVSTVALPVTNWYFVQMNQNRSPFNNPKARLAMFEATDPQPIINSVDRGHGKAIQDLEGPAQYPFFGYTLKGFAKYDATAAKKLVNALGGLSFNIITIANDARTVATAEALQKEWAAAGIHATLTILSHPQAVADNTTGNAQAEVDIYGLYANPLPSEETMVSCTNATNHFYCDPKADHLLSEIVATDNVKGQLKLYQKLWDIVENQDHGLLPLMTMPQFDALKSNVHGIQFGPIFPYFQSTWMS